MRLAESYKQRYVGLLGRYFDEVEGYIVQNYLDRMGRVVVDLGSGTGRLIAMLRQHQKDVLAVDLSFDDLALSKDKPASRDSVLFACADAATLPIGNETVDAVVAMGIYQHIADIEPHFSEVARILKDDGIFVFSVWNKRPLLHFPGLGLDSDQIGHEAHNIAKALERAGFDLLELRSTFFMPRRIFWAANRLMSRTPLYRIFIKFAIGFEMRLSSSSSVGLRGWELIFVAKRHD